MAPTFDDLANLDATAQAELVRRGEVSPLELSDAAIARIEKTNPAINAVITPLFDKARATAASRELPHGPFRGVPFLLKDLVAHSAGDPYYAGMRLLRELRWVERNDTYLVSHLRAAGFVLLGKTSTPELGSVPTTEPAAFGPTRNPWDLSRSPGGSSGGSAAAVAAGLVPAAHANDGGGSIRIPASACGLVGLKPTRGRVSLGPDFGESWSGMTAELAVTRSVRDTAAILDAVAGAMPGDPYFAPPPRRPFVEEVGADPGRLRIGFLSRLPTGQDPPHPECASAALEAARLLESLGHAVEESWPRALEDASVLEPFTTIVASCTARDLDDWSRRTGKTIGPEDVEPSSWAAAEMGRRFTARDYVFAIEGLHGHTRRLASWWATQSFDLLVTPTTAEPTPLLGELTPTTEEPLRGWSRSGPFVGFTSPYNISGQPAISLPLHWTADGLPIGVQLVAAYGREDLLLRVAAQLEQAKPWAGRRPPVHA